MLNKNTFLLWQGQLVSQLGTQAFNITMMFYLMQSTGSSSLMGLIMTLGMLPGIFVGPLAGVFVDSLSRKAIIIVSDIVRGLGVLSIAALIYLQPDNATAITVGFCLVVMLSSLVRSFFQPAVMATIADLADKDKLDKTNALFQSTTQFTQVVGQAVSGILYRVLGAPLLLLVDAISYLLSAISESFIEIPEQTKKQHKSVKQALAEFGDSFKAGLSFVKTVKGMFPTMMFICTVNFLVAPVLLLLPFYAEKQIKGDAGWYGFLLSALAVGSIAGSVWAAKKSPKDEQRPKFMLLSTYISGLSVILLGWTQNPYVALVAMSGLGCSIGMFNVPALTLFQTAPEQSMRGRVMGLLQSIVSAAMPLSFLLAGVAGDLTGHNTLWIFCSMGAVLVMVTLYVANSQQVRDFMAGRVKSG